MPEQREHRALSGDAGLTLVEVVVAMGRVVAVGVSLLVVLSGRSSALTQSLARRQSAVDLADEAMALVRIAAPAAATATVCAVVGGRTAALVAAQSAAAPPDVAAAAATGTALQLRTCSGAPSQRLVVNREVTAADGTVDHARSYTIVDSTGRCLDVGPQTAASAGNVGTTGWSSVRWSACTGGSAQKWNAPPRFTPSSQTGFREDS